jgi:hypothetical protein
MAKERAKIYVVFGEGDQKLLVATVILRGHDLYTIRQLFPLKGKHSYHESGIWHSDSDLVGLRDGDGRGVSLRDLKGHLNVTGLVCGAPPELADYEVKPDKSRTRTLALPCPVTPWGLDIWAVEAHGFGLANRIARTLPWPKTELLGSFIADWTEPLILVTAWQGVDAHPYQVVKRYPPIPGEVPYVLVPEKWVGTWLYDSRKTSQVRQRMQCEAEEFTRREEEHLAGSRS